MKILYETKTHIAFDDFLAEDEFGILQEYVNDLEYEKSTSWIKAWDLADEMPWQSAELLYPAQHAVSEEDTRPTYPTGLAFDLLVNAMTATDYYQQHFGSAFCARSYLHPPKSSLDWHIDHGRYAGAFAYYTHPYWHASWGGELMLIEEKIDTTKLPEKRIMADGKIYPRQQTWNKIHKNDLSEALINQTQSARFVFPKPNRMVFIQPGYFHKVALVKHNAAASRCSIAGFFFYRYPRLKPGF